MNPPHVIVAVLVLSLPGASCGHAARGLRGKYYDTADFTSLVTTRTDANSQHGSNVGRQDAVLTGPAIPRRFIRLKVISP